MSDLRRIQHEAEILNQPSIKALCQKVLLSYAQNQAGGSSGTVTAAAAAISVQHSSDTN